VRKVILSDSFTEKSVEVCEVRLFEKQWFSKDRTSGGC
jgi:hypothetical protein